MSQVLKDPVNVVDSLVINNDTNHEITGKSGDVIGNVDVLYTSRYNGKEVFTRKFSGHNDLLVTGAVYLMERANGIRSRYATTPVDVDLGIHTIEQIDRTDKTLPNEVICGFMIGNEGAGSVYNTVRAVNRSIRSVMGPIPFRTCPEDNDLTGDERDKYFLRLVKDGYVYYYGKKFEVEREIAVMYEDGTTVPLDVSSLTQNKFIKVFTRYKCYIDALDVREYFKITEGSTVKSLMNSIGLITGYPGQGTDGKTDYFNVRGMTVMNMENQELKDSESTIDFNYRLHIQ